MIPKRIRQALGAVTVALLLIGCSTSPGNDTPVPAEPSVATESPGAAEPSATEDAESGGEAEESEEAPQPGSGSELADGSIAVGAVAASAEFPFPVPEGWQVLEPFTADKMGKTPIMYAMVEYPGDAKDAADLYISLLQASGFSAERYPLGEVTNQASLIASGTVNGQSYTGTMDFDVFADGLQKVAINLSEEK